MSDERWDDVDTYFAGLFVPPDDALDGAIRASEEAQLPRMAVSPNQGKFLHVLARAHGARNILEIGTLGGYSTIWLARALAPGGKLVTLELDPKHFEVARWNIARAGLTDVVEQRLGPALASLSKLVEEGAGPFDLVFIDADKASSTDYLNLSLRMTRPGSLIIIDNVVRQGKVADMATDDVNALGVRKAMEAMAANPKLLAAGVQTVGSKGYDGFAIAVVIE